MAALRYSLTTYGHVADWFLKCDDDTYASVFYKLRTRLHLNDKTAKLFTCRPSVCRFSSTLCIVAKRLVERVRYSNVRLGGCKFL